MSAFGRPSSGLSKKEIAARSRVKNKVKNLSINGELLERFGQYKDAESARLGYKLTNKQFLAVLLNQWKNCEEDNGYSG
jgi:hypothetical protein